MIEHFKVLLSSIVNNPNKEISKLELLTEKEKKQILIDWNNTTVDYPQDKCIHQLFEEQVIQTPDNIAIVFEEEKLTYKQLNEKANQLANYLVKQGVKSEILVGICCDRSLQMIIAILAVLKAGGCYMPIDPNYPQERLEFMLKDSQISILLTQQQLVNNLDLSVQNIVKLDHDWELITQENKENLINFANPHSLAYVIYTSGSTGKPKGVMIEHGSIVNTIYHRITRQFPQESLSSLAFFISISFDGSVAQLFSTLAVGGKLTILNSIEQINDLDPPEDFTIIITSPTVLSNYLKIYKLPKSLQVLGIGGEKVSQELVRSITNDYPELQIHLIYGPTEVSVFCSSFQV